MRPALPTLVVRRTIRRRLARRPSPFSSHGAEPVHSREAGLAAFAAVLEADYGLPITHWVEASAWSETQKLQVSRTLDALIAAPISDVVEASPDAVAASETGARRLRALSDTKIAARDWEGSWPWELLAAIDNATKQATGGMVTPADPRMLILRTRYGGDFFTLLAAYLAEVLCARALQRWFEAVPEASRSIGELLPETAVDQAAALRQISGLESVSPAFLAGLLFTIARLGPKAFCDWCEDLR